MKENLTAKMKIHEARMRNPDNERLGTINLKGRL
jgi:hypothetical protein